MYPPIYITARKAIEDIHTKNEKGKIHIKKGETILIIPYLTHRHDDFWTDSETFSPERFQNTAIDSASFIPFGLGERRCIGEHFAMIVGPAILVTLLKQYEFTTNNDYLPVFMANLHPQTGMALNVRKYSSVS